MITTTNTQESVQWSGALDNYKTFGTYYITDGVITNVTAEVYRVKDDSHLGSINYVKLNDGSENERTNISYDCEYKNLDELSAVLPQILSDIDEHRVA